MAMNNLDVANAWAGQTRPNARSSNGNFHFQGTVLYSYSTPIAKLVTTPSGKVVALHWAHEYSVTTAGKHRSAMLRALRYENEFQVPAFGASGGRKLIEHIDHEMNVAHLLKQIDLESERLSRARTNTCRNRIEVLIATLAAYKTAFDL